MPSFLEQIDGIRVYAQGNRRAPHKPLLLLTALSRARQGESQLAPYATWKEALLPLLEEFAPPVVGRPQPELPYWHLRTDGLWEIPGSGELPLGQGGFPQMGPLRATRAGLPLELHERLRQDPQLVRRAARLLLDRHFPPTLHRSILDAVGLELNDTPPEEVHERPPRDPDFRRNLLRAYESRCAVTGFRASLSGTYFAVEAAHVQWHACGGPDTVANGLVLNPLLHLLFDRGAWSLTDDRRVAVSAHFTGNDEAVRMVRDLHGQKIRQPLPGSDPVSVEYIRWHREPELGGVFRQPALP